MVSDDKKFHDKFAEAANTLESYLNWSSFNILFIYIRIMNYVTFNKALSFLQDTMKAAIVDIFYFLIMIVIILLGFVFFAYLSFGHTLLNYSNVENSFMHCFSMIIGEFSFEELNEADDVMSYLFFYIFMVFFTFILLNIFIAILERAYTRVKESIGEDEQKTNYLESLLIFFVSKIKKLLNRKEQVRKQDEDNKELAISVFHRIPAGDEEEDDPKAWAISKSEEILLERHKRIEIKAPLDVIFGKRKQREIDGRSLFFGGNDDPEAEMRARLDYWEYLRVGYLTYLNHENKVKNRTEEKIKQSIALYDSYNDLLKERDLVMETIQPLENSLDLLKENNYKLLEEIRELEEAIEGGGVDFSKK